MSNPILTFDHSQRSVWQSCKRLHFFRHGLGIRKATPDSAGFSFGSAFHASSETLDIIGDINSAMAQFIEMFSYPDDKVRTLVRARELLLAYQTYTKQKRWRFTQTSPSTMEIAFNEPLTSRINYAGRCDRQFNNGDIGEWKTTYYLYNSSGNAMPYLQQWWGHNSIRGYAWARKAPAVVVLGVGVYPQKEGRGGKPYPCIESLRIPIQPWEIEQFIMEVTEIGEELIHYYQKYDLSIGENFEENMEKNWSGNLWHGFATNTSRCYFNLNNACQFLDLCTRNVPKGLVEANYVLDPFLPWMEEAENGE